MRRALKRSAFLNNPHREARKMAVFTSKSGAMECLVKDAEDLQRLPHTARRVMLEWGPDPERRQTNEDSLKNIYR
jgi:hypothetical protein